LVWDFLEADRIILQGPTPPLNPPQRTSLPLWLALLLKRQKRCNIVPPPFLDPTSLGLILASETSNPETFSPPPPHLLHKLPASEHLTSPPFLPSCTASADPDFLPYHWLDIGEILLEAASDDIPSADQVRTLLRDLREVRMAKMRGSMKALDGGGVFSLRGVGALEVAEGRGFIVGVMDGLRRIGASREAARREREEEGAGDEGDEDDDMEL
jgi:GINS complex subunit 2